MKNRREWSNVNMLKRNVNVEFYIPLKYPLKIKVYYSYFHKKN